MISMDLIKNREEVRSLMQKAIKDNDIDMAVVLYSVSNFVTDTNLFTLRQP